MILPIYVYGSDVLREKAIDVDLDNIDREEFNQFVADMYQTMKSADGVGLAAPQVGKSIRFLVVDGSDYADTYAYLKNFRRTMINPRLLEQSDETIVFSEGCLSIPDVHCDVVRPKKIKVEYYDENYMKQVEEFDEFACRMVQHEMDHLDGVMFVDHAAPIRKKMISSRLYNIAKGKVSASYKIKLVKNK